MPEKTIEEKIALLPFGYAAGPYSPFEAASTTVGIWQLHYPNARDVMTPKLAATGTTFDEAFANLINALRKVPGDGQ